MTSSFWAAIVLSEQSQPLEQRGRAGLILLRNGTKVPVQDA